MGDVYLALDTRLGRHVALKFLSYEGTADYSMLYRLQQEARTASALNHPNIVTVYEIGELDGEPFIASEFIDGATLRTAMQRKAIDVSGAIDVAIQVASALVAAHSAGVVHRDLKPGNIMVRPDGYVKVIDFGLAKQIRKAAGPLGSDLTTQTGSVMGTVDYMSPEQARGGKVDHRTDIWSLGVVLYEMVAQRRPFGGQTDSHIIVSILDTPLPPLPEDRPVPAGLSHILECALAKEPAQRYASASEMLRDLQQISPGSRSGSAIGIGAFDRGSPVLARRIFAIAGGVLVCIALLLAWRWARRGPEWFQIGSVRQLTFNERTLVATISPDGNYLAFVVGEAGGEQTLFLKQIDSSTEEVKIPARRIDYVGLTFSLDSKYLYETEKDESMTGRLYAIPILGSRPSVPLVEDIDGPVSFSPNADQFAFVRFRHIQHAGKEETTTAIFISSADGFEKRQLISLSEPTYECIAWSARGDHIAAILFPNLPGRSGSPTLDLIDRKGHETRKPLPDWRVVGRPFWTPDSKTLILPAANRAQADNQLQLRQVAVDSGLVHDITVGLTGYKAASLARNGAEIAATKLESSASVWVSRPDDFTRGRTFFAEADLRPSLAWSDQNHLVVNSQRSGYPNLWLLDMRAQGGSSLTNEPFAQQDAAASPGGKSIVFASNRSGEFKIWRFDKDRAALNQLTFGKNYDEAPALSPDGKWIVYTSWTGNFPHLRKVASTGGDSMQVSSYPARDAQISPDGNWIACYMQDSPSGYWRVVIIPVDGSGTPRPVPGAHSPLRWSPNGKALTSVITDKGVSNIWSVPLDGSQARQLTHFDEALIQNLAWSPDGTQIACLRMRLGADVELFTRQKSR